MTIEITPNGYILISRRYKGDLIKMMYVGYSKTESVKLFRRYYKEEISCG